ncbi:MAG: oligoendopeptidase F [Chlamydiia bacterium]|nr:oligoendopeptidase F [Chlamydiia bacterium]
MTTQRADVATKDTWNVEAMYPNLDAWNADFSSLINGKAPQWKPIADTQGRLSESPEVLAQTLEKYFLHSRRIEKLYTYAHLRHDEEITNDTHKSAFNKIVSTYHQFAQDFAWLEPEILSLPPELLQQYLNNQQLAPYRFYLEKILRRRAHTLPAEQEALMALSAKALQASSKAFSAINDADFKFGVAVTESGEERPITHGSYGLFIRDQDRTLRSTAFKRLHKQYKSYENTLCELLNGCVQSHLFNARARKHTSCVEAALFDKNIDVSVYTSLIEAVGNKIDVLHRYMALRKRVMGVDTLHLYDVYVPMTKAVNITLSYDEAVEACCESVAPLGRDYQDSLRQGLHAQRWVDRYENRNKRSGAYSSGCYDSYPYVLMNFKGVLRDAFTLAHEAGHSMHSFLSHKSQPYHYGDYPIFLAEVASTFNEELLNKLLMERFTKREEQIFLINERIEDLRATLFRQTMFAEFELEIHQMAERNEPLTPTSLKDKYIALNKKYFGPATHVCEEIAWEWARIPHFYYNFYVYQYATGISAALALVNRVLKGGDKERDDYLGFLKSGCSRYPLEILQSAGVDMRTPQPVEQALAHFGSLVDQLEALIG